MDVANQFLDSVINACNVLIMIYVNIVKEKESTLYITWYEFQPLVESGLNVFLVAKIRCMIQSMRELHTLQHIQVIFDTI